VYTVTQFIFTTGSLFRPSPSLIIICREAHTECQCTHDPSGTEREKHIGNFCGVRKRPPLAAEVNCEFRMKPTVRTTTLTPKITALLQHATDLIVYLVFKNICLTYQCAGFTRASFFALRDYFEASSRPVSSVLCARSSWVI
jgi:hypothetical protein